VCDVSVGLHELNIDDAMHDCCVILWLQLQFEPFRSVGILGFNSPEWLISNMAAIFAGFVLAFVTLSIIFLFIGDVIKFCIYLSIHRLPLTVY